MAKQKKNTPVQRKSSPDKGTIVLNVFDGTRRPLPDGADLYIRISDGAQRPLVNRYFKKSSIQFAVPFYDNFQDNYTVLVTENNYRDAGYSPVKVSPDLPAPVDLMLAPKNAKYQFLSWNDLKSRYPRFTDFLSCAGDENEARQHYEELQKDRQPALASLLNLTAAMSAINLPSGTPLDYFRRIEWDDSLAQDRFFGFADEKIVQQVRTAVAQREFVPEASPGLFHGDATSSFKQVQFGEANVQLTFHENTVEEMGGIRCIRVEPDIDDYKDPGAHALLEVIPNTLSHGRSDPQTIYVLRWIAGRHAGVPEFDPGYSLIA